MLTVNKILHFSLARVFLFYFGAQILFHQVRGKLAGRVSLMRWPGAPQFHGLWEEDLPGSGVGGARRRGELAHPTLWGFYSQCGRLLTSLVTSEQ